MFTQKPYPEDEVEYVLIGAGLPRTGTLSTMAALEIILPGRCHHMVRAAYLDKTDRNITHWKKAVAGELTQEEWRKFVRDERLSASVDYPTSLFWKDLVKVYPNAKVLLNDRDPVKWFQSVKNTVYELTKTRSKPFIAFNPLLQAISFIKGFQDVPKITLDAPTPLGEAWPKGICGAIESGEEESVRFFNEWKAEVIKEVSADRLLVYQVKDGWEPLCQFLNLPVPNEPFPNVNDTPAMKQNIRIQRNIAYGSWAVTFAFIASAAYYFL